MAREQHIRQTMTNKTDRGEATAATDRSGPPESVIAAMVADQDAIANSRMAPARPVHHLAVEYTEVAPMTLALVRRAIRQKQLVGRGINASGRQVEITCEEDSADTSAWRIRSSDDEPWRVCYAPPAHHHVDFPSEQGWKWADDVVARAYVDAVYFMDGTEVTREVARAALHAYRNAHPRA